MNKKIVLGLVFVTLLGSVFAVTYCSNNYCLGVENKVVNKISFNDPLLEHLNVKYKVQVVQDNMTQPLNKYIDVIRFKG